jgi:hypothetical protein
VDELDASLLGRLFDFGAARSSGIPWLIFFQRFQDGRRLAL